MVLILRAGLLVVLVLAGCSESLFGAHRAVGSDGGGRADGSDAPAACRAPCVADAGAEYNGSPGGIGGHWRYLDDSRSPQNTWSAMNLSGGEMIGSGDNRITSCALHPDRAACGALPGALLVSSTGAASATDPAIELTALTGQVIELSLQVYLPAGADQTIWLYRNSREDLLFKAVATAGVTLGDTVTLDALPGDRFLVAVAPGGDGTADVGLQLFASAVGQPFPSTCQLALRFDTVLGNTTTDLTCVRRAFTHVDATGTQTSLAQAVPPFPELIDSISNPAGTYLHDFDPAAPLDYSHDVTVQLWANLRSFVSAGAAAVFSDLDAGAGVEISIAPALVSTTVAVRTSATTSELVELAGPYPSPNMWHFIRVVRTGTTLRVCVDGALAGSMDSPLAMLPASHAPDLGKDLAAPMTDASFDGLLDEVRVITGALPCP